MCVFGEQFGVIVFVHRSPEIAAAHTGKLAKVSQRPLVKAVVVFFDQFHTLLAVDKAIADIF